MERYVFDENQPHGSMSLQNLRNVLRALHECDFLTLRPNAEFILDPMEYGTADRAQSNWSDFVAAVVKPSATAQTGNYAMAISDCGVDDVVQRNRNMNLSAYEEVKLWIQQDEAGPGVNFFLKDSSSGKASWDLDEMSGVSDTFMSELLDLASPDYGSTDLSDVVTFGFSDLVSDTQYIIDDIRARVGMAVAVESSSNGGYYENVYAKGGRVSFAGGASPAIVAPSSNPRIDALFYSSDLYWKLGSEAASPSEPSLSPGTIPVCFVYSRPTMSRVVAYEEQGAYPDEGFIYKDIRPIFNWGITNHSLLEELTSDTHTQYTLAAGSRSFTGDQSLGGNKLTHLKKASSGSDAVRFDQLSDAISYREVSAWAVCDGAGVIRKSYNVSSVSYTSDGQYHVTLTTALGESDFAVLATAGVGQIVGQSDFNMNASEFVLRVTDNGGSLESASILNFCVFGS